MMRIGIFGDSYAAKTASTDAWWQRLIHDHNHDVVCYGVGGSSIPFSLNLVNQFHQQHDLNIWCLTTPGRFSVPMHNTEFFHSTGWLNVKGDIINRSNKIETELVEICQKYLKYVCDLDYENFVGTLIANHFLSTLSNLMIIPCFAAPLHAKFNLYALCNLEIQTVFPGKQAHEIYQNYQDVRTCHLTKKNNQILADLINGNLLPGIFQTDYENFNFNNIHINQIVTPI